MLTIRAAGGGPEARVAVHVKHQQAGEERVEDDSTCVLRRNVRANVFWCMCMLYILCFETDSAECQHRHTGSMCEEVATLMFAGLKDALQLGVSEQRVLPWGRQGGRGL